MPKKTVVGIFPHNPQDASDQPFWMMEEEIPDSFLDEEVSFGKTVGQTFHISDLANMWCDLALVKALLKHPEAIRPLKDAARRRNIKVKPINLKDFNFLTVTDQYLWENNLDTVEDLVTNVYRRGAVTPDELVKYDLDNAFRSVYGISLGFTA